MRVGIFTNAYRPIISGVVNSVDLIRKGLLSQGHVPFVFAPRFPGYRETHAGVYRFCSLSLSRQVKFPLPCPYSPGHFARIPRLKLDVLHTHHPFLLGRTAIGFADRLGIPLVFTFHTQYEQYAHYIPFQKKLVQAVGRRLVVDYASRCDLIVCPSPVMREVIERDYRISTRLEVLPNAIDLSAFENVERTGSLGFGEDEVVALYAGRIGLEKNLEFLLRAFARVDFPRARLAIVGDGPVLGSLRRLASELGLESRVRFTGRVDYAHMPGYYAAADFFAITSTTEVKPLVVLEALASGLPVIAVAACGTQDTLTHGQDGLLSECDQGSYTALLQQAFSQAEQRRRMGEQARLTAREFAIGPYVRRLTELYASLSRRR